MSEPEGLRTLDLGLAKRVLGVVSLGLGIVAVVAPRRFSHVIGLENSPEKVAAFGARELAAGAALLSPVKPSPFLWTRVFGDVIDLVGLATAYREADAKRPVLAAATAGVLVIMAFDFAAAAEASRRGR
jgi:hypothetical protein